MIRLNDVGYIYEGAEQPALSNIDLHIREGEFVAVVGRNGSGKSTLAKLLNALLIPTKGSVTIFGMDTKDESKTLEIRKNVGIVFQNPDNQIVTTVVEEDVGFGPENLGVPTAEIIERVHKALEAVGMLAYARSAPHMLSGGQKQRVAIAGILAIDPAALVLDEATAMLDPLGRKQIMNIAVELNRKKDKTIVMITQYMDEAALADRIIVMNDGKIVMDGAPREIFAKGEDLREIGLDAPPMARLRDELIRENIIAGCDALTVEELAEKICLSLSKI